VDVLFDERVIALEQALGCNEAMPAPLEGTPFNGHLGGGAVAQSVWNQLSGVVGLKGRE
jgi:hypothetical protein